MEKSSRHQEQNGGRGEPETSSRKGQAVKDEEMLNEIWRKRCLGVGRRADDLEQVDRPTKKSRRTMEEDWGLGQEAEELLSTRKWLHGSVKEVPLEKIVQTKLS